MRAGQLLLAVGLAVALAPASAEISVSGSTPINGLVQLTRTGAPESEIWDQIRVVAPQLLLNVDGTNHGDHSPALGVNRQTGHPEAVWCYWDGADTEIAWSRFDGQTWSAPELITSDSVNDGAPSIAFGQGGETLVAWEHHTGITRIEYRERQTSGTWSPAVPVSDDSANAHSPSVAQYQGRVRVGYIQPDDGSQRAIKIASAESSDPWPAYFSPEIIAQISFSGDIAPELHSYPNQLFTTWVNSSNEIGFARFNGTTWQAPQTETYTSAEDLPKARIRAKSRALHSP